MDDLISRQAAIEALGVEPLAYAEYEQGLHDKWIDIKQNIEALPSAQPEIIRCNSCKHWTQSTGKMNGYGLGRCDFHDAYLVACSGFCYWAERRTDE
jgi:hypothetical protein